MIQTSQAEISSPRRGRLGGVASFQRGRGRVASASSTP
jgi:hypothetical protein